MKQLKNKNLLLISIVCFFNSCVIYAATPKFSIIPTSGSITTFLLPSNFTETVSYTVTNNTNITRTLTMVPIAGITQDTSGGACGNPFVLARGQTCTLNLTINGSQIPSSGVQGGPVICKTKSASDNSPDPFLCSQPSNENTLAISTSTPGAHIYVANQIGNSVSFCQVNPATGFLSQCSIAVTGTTGVEGVGFNPAGTHFYSANLGSSTITVCNVNATTGALSGCVDAGGSGFSGPDAVAFSPDGTIFYTSNVGNTVTACLVDATTGQLSSCVNNASPTFNAASDMVINNAGTLAYVSNRGSSTVSICNVSGQTVNSCNALSGSLFDGPEGIKLDPSELHAYITNANNFTVTLCDVLQDGTGLLANCRQTDGTFRGTGNLATDPLGMFAYIPDQLLNQVVLCLVTTTNGSLTSCGSSHGTTFDGPSGIAVH